MCICRERETERDSYFIPFGRPGGRDALHSVGREKIYAERARNPPHEDDCDDGDENGDEDFDREREREKTPN